MSERLEPGAWQMFAERVVEVLEPLVGRTVADSCVRASALESGIAADGLGPQHVPLLEGSVRQLLEPVAPQITVDHLLLRIRQEAGRCE